MNERSLTQKSLHNFLGKDDEKIQYLDIKKEQNRRKKSIVDVPKPFLKWVGGKRQLILQMNDYFPKAFNKYIEPFVGGGAIFCYLLKRLRHPLVEGLFELG